MIEAKKLSKTYQLGKLQVHAMLDVSFCIVMGEFVAIMGPSGSGKSTLMNLIGCLDLPSSGSYLLEGIDIRLLNSNQLADMADFNKKSWGYVRKDEMYRFWQYQPYSFCQFWSKSIFDVIEANDDIFEKVILSFSENI